jgi:tetratricopeptide (TPR) repeat protein
MRLTFMLLGLILIPSLVAGAVYGERRHLLRTRLMEAQDSLGRNSAEAFLDRLVEDYPNNAEAHFLRARQFRLAGQDAQALESLKQAAALGGHKPLLNREKILVLAHLDFRRMQRYLQLVLDRDPLDRDVLLALAQGNYRQSHFDKAELLVNRWLEHKPDDLEALFLRGQIAVHAHHWEEAANDLGKVIHAGPDQLSFRTARKLLASAYLELGKFQEAYALLLECRQEEPRNTEVLFNLGQGASFLQRWNEALAAFEEALRLRPDRDVMLKAAYVHEMRHELPAALALLEKAENNDPKDLEVISSMARVLQGLGNTERAQVYRKRYDLLKDMWINDKVQSTSK